MKKIRNKIVIVILGAILITSAVLGIVSVTTTISASSNTTKDNLVETASIAAAGASSTIGTYTVAVGEMATSSVLTSGTSSPEEMKAYIDGKAAQYYMRKGGFINAEGVEIFTNENLSGSSFFTSAMAGSTVFSEPIVNASGTDAYIAVSAPVKNGDTTLGVLYYYCDTLVLQNLVEASSLGETGNAYILDKNGTTIAYNDYEYVLSKANTIADSAADSSLAILAEIERDMIRGATGLGIYVYNGVNEYQAYAPIPGTNGWSMAVTASESELLNDALSSVTTIVIICAVMVILGIILAGVTSSSISKPITACVNRLDTLAHGDLKTKVPDVHTKDETKQLAESSKAIIDNLSAIIFDLDGALAQIAKGNLDINFNKKELYVGDYGSLYKSVLGITQSLSYTLNQINAATEQVNSGGGQVAMGSQELAQGATEQAAAIEKLAATIDNISEKSLQTAEDSRVAKEANARSQESLETSNNQMAGMLSAMEQINEKANEISKIVKTIDDIAFQTNILALNAAVEAARAGSAGKGFAVVADEVRNLAAKSAQSAQDTTALIEDTIAVVENGNKIAHDTSDSIASVSENAKELGELVDRIAGAVLEQATATEEIKVGVNQISSVIQTNTATAEESAAVSEELSGQAQTLKDLVGQFKISDV